MSTKTRALVGAALVVLAAVGVAASWLTGVARPTTQHASDAKLDKLHPERPIAAREDAQAAAARQNAILYVAAVDAQQKQVAFLTAWSTADQQAAAAAAAANRRPAGRARRASSGSASGNVAGTLACIRRHESDTSGGYRAVNRRSGASGAYQVLDSTWQGYGGYAHAADAPAAVQDQWATTAIAQAGTRPWAGSGC